MTEDCLHCQMLDVIRKWAEAHPIDAPDLPMPAFDVTLVLSHLGKVVAGLCQGNDPHSTFVLTFAFVQAMRKEADALSEKSTGAALETRLQGHFH